VKTIKLFCAIVAFLSCQCCFAAAAKYTCEVIATKAPAWDKFDVVITMNKMLGKEIGEKIATFNLPKKTDQQASVNTVKQTFDCYKFKQFRFIVTYNPPIWHTTTGKATANVFHSQKSYDLSSAVGKQPENPTLITIKIDFPKDFGITEDPNLLKQK
jgi:hypothetical protein